VSGGRSRFVSILWTLIPLSWKWALMAADDRSVAYLLAYLGASWYFVGEARPRRLFLVDALPQLASTIVGIVVLVVTRGFTLMVTTQLLFNLGAVGPRIAVVLSGNSGVKDAYAFAHRLFRFAVTAFSPVLQFIQGWIPEGGLPSMVHRIHRALQLTPVLGLLGGTGLAASAHGPPMY
jgi:hypothetical protein